MISVIKISQKWCIALYYVPVVLKIKKDGNI